MHVRTSGRRRQKNGPDKNSAGTWRPTFCGVKMLAHQPTFAAISPDFGDAGRFGVISANAGRVRPIVGEFGQLWASSANSWRVRPMLWRFRPTLGDFDRCWGRFGRYRAKWADFGATSVSACRRRDLDPRMLHVTLHMLNPFSTRAGSDSVVSTSKILFSAKVSLPAQIWACVGENAHLCNRSESMILPIRLVSTCSGVLFDRIWAEFGPMLAWTRLSLVWCRPDLCGFDPSPDAFRPNVARFRPSLSQFSQNKGGFGHVWGLSA